MKPICDTNIEPGLPVDKPMVVAENTAMRPGIASLSQHMLNKDLTQFMQSLSWAHQNQASEKKAQLAGCLTPRIQIQIHINFIQNKPVRKKFMHNSGFQSLLDSKQCRLPTLRTETEDIQW